jgi:dihydroneopterin aldolase
MPFSPTERVFALADDISRTVDYHAAARRIVSVAASRPRRLIENAGQRDRRALVGEFRALRAEVEVRKFILPDTKYVAVRCICNRRPE